MNFILSAKLDLEVRYKEIKFQREQMEKEISGLQPNQKSDDQKKEEAIMKKNQQIVQYNLENQLFLKKKEDMMKKLEEQDKVHQNKL